jgi:hypothetical protein
MPAAQSLLFSAAARTLGAEARRMGLQVPGFRCPPRAEHVVRSIRRYADGGAVVAVRLRGRPHGEVVEDMVAGILVANRLEGARAARAREHLLATALGDDTSVAA